jgi:hypothetical protein
MPGDPRLHPAITRAHIGPAEWLLIHTSRQSLLRLPCCLIPDLTVGLLFLFIDPRYRSIHIDPLAIATLALTHSLLLRI